MPSYHLTNKMNLGDVDDTIKSRKTLKINTFGEQNSNDVNITNGDITINNFQLYSNNIEVLSYLKNNNGNVEWGKTPIPVWAQSELSNVSINSFCNDKNFEYLENIKDISFTQDYTKLNSRATISQILEEKGIKDDVYIKSLFGLSEITNNKNNLRDIYSNLGLKELAFEPVELTEVRDLTVTKTFTIFGESNQIGNILIGTKCNDFEFTELSTTTTHWYDVFYDNYSNLKEIFILIDSFSNDSIKNSVTANRLSNAFEILDNKIDINQGFDANVVLTEILIEEMILNSVFCEKFDNLDKLNNKEYARSNLELGDLATINNNIIDSYDILIKDSIIWNKANQIFDFTNINISYLGVSNNDNIILKNLPKATLLEEGIVFFNSNTLDELPQNYIFSLNEVYNISTFRQFKNEILENLDDIESNVKRSFVDFGIDSTITFIDNKFNAFIGHNHKILEAYSNIKLKKNSINGNYVSVSGDYNDLIIIPTTLESFSNDIGFFLASSNCVTIENKKISRQNILCGDLSVYDRDNFLITNGNAELFTGVCYNSFTYNYDDDIINKWLFSIDNNGTTKWYDLQIATSNSYGVVKKINTYEIASYDAVVTVDTIKRMYTYFDEKLKIIEDKFEEENIPY